MAKKCAHPDCHHHLARNNITGVCITHIHSEHCQCARCVDHRAKTKVRRIPKGCMVVQVADFCTSSVPLYADVTLPKYPWRD